MVTVASSGGRFATQNNQSLNKQTSVNIHQHFSAACASRTQVFLQTNCVGCLLVSFLGFKFSRNSNNNLRFVFKLYLKILVLFQYTFSFKNRMGLWMRLFLFTKYTKYHIPKNNKLVIWASHTVLEKSKGKSVDSFKL